MKGERRHEIQNNTLATVLTDLPLYVRFHANKILIGVIVICLAVLLVRHRINSSREAKLATHAALQSAEIGIEQLKSIDRTQSTDVARAQERKKIIAALNTAVDQVMQNTSDPEDSPIRAEAQLTEGDMYWTLAGLPPLPGAATQPGLSMAKTPAQYLDDAEAAYQKVLKNYDAQKVSKASALFGLAAIEENRSNWDKAANYYKAINDDPQIPNVFKDVSNQRMTMLAQIKTPVFMGTFSATQPATAPSTTQSADTVPTSAPATMPATTQPQ